MTVPDDDRVPREHLEPGERDPEAAPEDVAEQGPPPPPAAKGDGAKHHSDQATENGDEDIHLGDDASEWDAVEQSRVVDLEDEDYR
jgi:hypothetical protein